MARACFPGKGTWKGMRGAVTSDASGIKAKNLNCHFVVKKPAEVVAVAQLFRGNISQIFLPKTYNLLKEHRRR